MSTKITEEEFTFFDSFHTKDVSDAENARFNSILDTEMPKDAKLKHFTSKYASLEEQNKGFLANEDRVDLLIRMIKTAETIFSLWGERDTRHIENLFKELENALDSDEKTYEKEESKESGIYFEKQRSLFCGMHALNNLFQQKIFINNEIDREEEDQFNLDSFCKRLKVRLRVEADVSLGDNFIDCPENGNYQYEVLLNALVENKSDVIQFPFGESSSFVRDLIPLLKKRGLKGFLINLRGNHWVAVTAMASGFSNQFVYLDSLSKTQVLKTNDELIHFLGEILQNDRSLILAVTEAYEGKGKVYTVPEFTEGFRGIMGA